MKNKIIASFIVAAIVLPGLTGCDKRLDVKPTQSIDESVALLTSSDVEAALIGAYSDLGDADVYGGSLFVAGELLGNANEMDWTGTFETYTAIYNKNIAVNNGEVSNVWLDSYKVINDANNVLGAIGVVLPAKQKRIEGEAKFIRASLYFDLIRLFAKPWNQGNPTQNDGIPIVLTATRAPLEYPSRAKVSAVYDQIIKDLTEAEAILPPTNGFFVSKFGAAAMLARVYLQKGDYTNAAAAADRVIKSNRFQLTPTYFDAFPYDGVNPNAVIGNTSEDVFAIQVSNTDGVNDFVTYFSPVGRGDIEITDAHLNEYEPDDERLLMFYDDGGSVRTGKFDMVYSNVHIIRLAEMYLTRAEANFRLGTAVGAAPMDDINRIRNRVALPSYTAAEVTLARILKERKLELAFEGLNLHDAKRTQRNIGILPWDSPKLVFPIPERERKVNKNLTQNDGYPQ